MKIQGNCVEKEEYALLAYDNISSVAAEFAQVEGVNVNGAEFWTSPIDGTTPMDRVKELTDKLILDYKSIQICARERGLIEDISFEGLKKTFLADEEERRKKKEDGEAVYGPTRLSMSQYYSYRQSQLEEALTQKIEQECIKVTEQDLKEFYPVMKQKESRKNFVADLEFYVWKPKEDPKDNEAIEEISIATLEMGKENQAYDEVVKAVWNLSPGDVSDVVVIEGRFTGIIKAFRMIP